MENKSQQYINEMEKNAKLFEEKLNKFKSYQTSEAYSQQDEYEEKENENFQINKKPYKNRSFRENQEQSEKSEEEYYTKPSRPRQKNKVYSSKKIYKKENSGKYNYKQKEQKEFNYNDNEEDYDDEYGHKQKMKTFNNFKQKVVSKSKEQSNEDLIEEMRADLIEKSNLIKKLDKDLKAKEKLPSKIEFDRLNSNHEKVS